MVRLLSRIPNLSNSPPIRSAPQSRFCSAISLISATLSTAIFGLGAADLDVYFQYSLNPWRCQREIRLWLDNEQGLLPCSSEKDQDHPIRLRECWSFDLPTERRIMSCCRRKAFSATSSDLLLLRSVSVPNMRAVVDGLVQSTKSWWSD